MRWLSDSLAFGIKAKPLNKLLSAFGFGVNPHLVTSSRRESVGYRENPFFIVEQRMYVGKM
jgi:hypothetical protein